MQRSAPALLAASGGGDSVSLFDALLARTGESARAVSAEWQTGRRGVSYSGELRRIEALPRRVRELNEPLRRLVTEDLRLPGGSMELWDIQAAAIADATLNGGAFLPIGVGQGKALISLLSPVAMEAERPVLFVPAQLRDQTLNHVIPEMRYHWRLHPRLRVIGYSELSLAKNARMLEELRPDLIILDECHSVKAPKAGRTRRLVRWFRAHPETKCVAMSGTVSNRSIRDFAHILTWCLKDSAPIPSHYNTLKEWAAAIDELKDEDQRLAPGELLRFCGEGENVRQGFRRRLVETPGVVASKEDTLGTSLVIRSHDEIAVSGKVCRAIENMRNTWETPNGDLIAEAVDLWRHVREMSLGFWYRWDPPPPRDWMTARRAWKSFVREVLRTNRRGLDTELQVWMECERATEPPKEWMEWAAVRDTFRPNSVAEWMSGFAVEAALKWLEGGGICWTEQVAFGEKLGERAPYYGAGNTDILTTPEPAIVASIAAHAEGKNLQRYSRNLVTSSPTSGKVWEQLLARTHRYGQQAAEVEVEVFLHVEELQESFRQARADARYLQDTYGNVQKLLYADVLV